ncbi:MAG TPA: hypothetical protein VHM24_10000 [Gemmatimonadaceae bacterium]|nr:hypothetical protein [Gemmatimonadaceae bacterium]
MSLSSLCIAVSLSSQAEGQTEYRNLEAGRPIRIADATPTERYGLDLDLTTLRIERLSLGRYRLQYEPRVAYGVLPRTEISFRMPSFYREPSISPRGGIAGVGLGAEHQIVMEGLHVPAIALAVEAFIPTGPNALRTSYSLKTLMTRSFRAGRVHLNGSYGTFAVRQAAAGGVLVPPVIDGPCDFRLPETGIPMRAACAPQTLSGSMPNVTNVAAGIVTKYRWTAAAGIDKSFPLRSLLVAADVLVEKYEGVARPADWTAEGGARKQLTQFVVVDGAVGRRFTGISTSWFVAAGTTVTMPFKP